MVIRRAGGGALKSNTAGLYNTAFGEDSLLENATGNFNTAIGTSTLFYNTTGGGNTVSGYSALVHNTTGSNNTGLGYFALYKNTTGGNNLAIGYQAGINVITGSNNIYLGSAGTLDESSTLRLGGTQTSAYIAGVNGAGINPANAKTVFIDNTGKLGVILSSQRYKDDIRDMSESSRRLLELRPVTFHYKQAAPDGAKPLEYGLIAEEVAKVYPDLVVRDKDGQIETVQYHKLTPMLLNEVQRLSKAWQAEKEQNLAQDNALKAEQSKVSVLEAHILAQDSQMQAQTRAVAELKQQVSMVQAQARRMETLAARLASLETKHPAGLVADARRP